MLFTKSTKEKTRTGNPHETEKMIGMRQETAWQISEEVPVLWRLTRATAGQMPCVGTVMLRMWRPKSLHECLQKIQITRGSRNLSNARGTLIRQKRRRISRWSGCALESKESDVHAVGFTKEINAEILADNKKVNFQIDCGESINIVPAKHAQGHEIKSTTKTLQMWNGSEVKPIGTARITMRNPKTRKKYSVEFVVVESDLTPLIRARVAQEMELITTNEENFKMTSLPPRRNELQV